MQDVNCYNCQSSERKFYASENGFSLLKCNNCGLLYVSPRPNDSDIAQAHKLGCHKGEKLLNTTNSYNKGLVSEYKTVLQDLFSTPAAISAKNWLDIGCGNGELLVCLREFTKGKIVTKGLEPNVHKQKICLANDLDVSCFDIESHQSKYDAISLLNVYSHLPDPPAAFAKYRDLLNPGGLFLLQTGDTANFDSNSHYRPFSLPDHLSFASETIIVNMLNKLGFEIVCIKKYPFLKGGSYPKLLAKEFIKMFWPGKNSYLKYLLTPQKYAATDMYILARKTAVAEK